VTESQCDRRKTERERETLGKIGEEREEERERQIVEEKRG